MKKIFKMLYSKTQKDYEKRLLDLLKDNQKKFIITANPETIMMAENDPEIKKMLLDTNNDIIPDGIAVVKAGRMLGFDIKERITGCDIAEFLLKETSNLKKKVYLFGAKEEVIGKLKNVIKEKYSNIRLVGASNGYVADRDKIMEEIIKLKPDVCLVALGIPHQEKLIYKYLDKFDKGIFVGVGGSFDVLSGSKKRAPKLFIKLNLEWLYRILKEPSRLKRFWNNNIKFMLKARKYKKSKF